MTLRWHGPEAIARIENHMRRNVHKATLFVLQKAKDNVSDGGVSGLHVRTGALRKSIDHEFVDLGMAGRVGTGHRYARIHEIGGTIVPKSAKALHFVIDGYHIFAKRVVIPARPYLRPAIDDNEGQIRRILSRRLRT